MPYNFFATTKLCCYNYSLGIMQPVCLQSLAPCHGLASGLLHHFESIIWNSSSAAAHGMVYGLVGEFDCHRTHYATFAAIAKPAVVTRLLLLVSQVRHHLYLQNIIAILLKFVCDYLNPIYNMLIILLGAD